MGWFNYYGLIAVAIIMVPNIIVAAVDKSAFENRYDNKVVLVIEQIGRYGCMAFTVFNIPYTYFDFRFENALTVYLAVGGVILALYVLGWIVFRKGRSTIKMLWLSITPTVFFLFCGVMVLSVPLIVFSILFGIGHITVSYKNRDDNLSGGEMVHKMSLAAGAFKAVAAGSKTVEMRLYDEKRKKLRVGDVIEFCNIDTHEVISCRVISLVRCKDFFEVYGMYDKISLGYNESDEARAEDMYEFYSAEKISAYGVLAIEIRLID